MAEDTVDEETHVCVYGAGAVVAGVACGCAVRVAGDDVSDGYFPWVVRIGEIGMEVVDFSSYLRCDLYLAFAAPDNFGKLALDEPFEAIHLGAR